MDWSTIANLAVATLGGGGALIAFVVFLVRLAVKVDRIDENVKDLVTAVDKLVDQVHDLGERIAKMEGRVEEHARNISDLSRDG